MTAQDSGEENHGHLVGQTESAPFRPSWRIILLFLILLPLAWIKVSFTPGARDFGLDAAYYFQIARNVASGEGLVTSVSLYHQALDPLPQSSSMIYPAWPVVLGMSGRVIGLMKAALLLPKLFYILDLLLLYMLTRVVSRSMGVDSLIAGTPIDAGHLMVVLFAANQMFFFSTSHPYTEGLAFAFAFAALLAFDRAARTRGLGWALAAGTLGGLAFLTRTQMIAVAMGIGLVACWGAIVSRRISKLLIGTFAPMILIIGGWYFLIYASPVQRADVSYFQMWVERGSTWEWLNDRLTGLGVGFDPLSSMSYVRLFGPSAYLPVLALIALMIDRLKKKNPMRQSDRSIFLATVLAGILSFGALNLFHEQFFLPWLFGWRHGLPYLFLLLPSVVYLLAEERRRSVRWGVVLLIVWSASIGIGSIAEEVSRPQRMLPGRAEIEMLRWLDRNHEGTPTLLTTQAQSLSVFTDANFHWMSCEDPPDRTREMIDHLPIDYVIVYGAESRCTYQSRSKLAGLLEVVEIFGEGEIFLLRPHEASASARTRTNNASPRPSGSQ